MEIKRGSIVTCVITGDFGKPRPALVIQADLYNPTHPSVVVLPITTHLLETPLFRIDIAAGKQNGLKQASQIMVDKVTALKRERIRQILGRVSPALMQACEVSLLEFLQLTA